MRQVLLSAGSAALAALAFAFGPAQGQPSTLSDSEDKEIARLIRQLGSSTFATREEAARTLHFKGVAALPPLDEAKGNSDREVARRAQQVINAINASLRPRERIASAVFSQDRTIALLWGHLQKDLTQRHCQVWVKDLKANKDLAYLQGLPNPIGCIALSADGRFALCGGQQEEVDRRVDPPKDITDYSIVLWDLQKKREMRRLKGHTGQVRSVAFSPDGQKAVSAGGRLPPHSEQERGSYHDNTVRVWQLQTGEELRRFEGHSHWILSASFSPNGKQIVSSAVGQDHTMRLWDIASGRELQRFDLTGDNFGSHPSFFPDGRHILTLGAVYVDAAGKGVEKDGQTVYTPCLRIWDTATGKEVRRIEGVQGYPRTVAISLEGRRVLSGGDGGYVVQLWNFPEGKEVCRFPVGPRSVTTVAFCEDANQAACICSDGTVFYWDLPK